MDIYHCHHPSINILICTDSKSLCKALLSSNSRTSSIHEYINSIFFSIYIQWIPGHCDIPGNELADRAAKQVTNNIKKTILPALFTALYRLSSTRFMTIHHLTNELHEYTNMKRLHVIRNKPRIKRTKSQKIPP